MATFDFFSARRAWKPARERYLSLGLTIIPHTSTDGEREVAEFSRFGRLGDDLRTALEQGDQVSARALLEDIWRGGRSGTVFEAATLPFATGGILQALPALRGNLPMLSFCEEWLVGTGSVNAAQYLRQTAGESVGIYESDKWVDRARQAREMEFWSDLYERTEAFRAAPEVLIREMNELAERQKGMSASGLKDSPKFIGTLLKAFAQIEASRTNLWEILKALVVEARGEELPALSTGAQEMLQLVEHPPTEWNIPWAERV